MAVDDEAGDLLAAALAGDMGLVRVDSKALVGGDSADRSEERAELWLVLVRVGEAEREIVGVARVTPAEPLGERREAAIEAEAKRVGEGRARGGALRQAAGAEGDIIGLAVL